jgi:hypothetical protein
MIEQGAITRFARWGFTHGPAWGTVAGATAGLLLARTFDLTMAYVELIVLGAFVGLLAGPLLAVAVGAVCVAAEHAPRWLLDAPDYVAVLTVVGIVALVGWPTLQLADASTSVSMAGVALIAVAPTVDAARSAPKLLHPHFD